MIERSLGRMLTDLNVGRFRDSQVRRIARLNQKRVLADIVGQGEAVNFLESTGSVCVRQLDS